MSNVPAKQPPCHKKRSERLHADNQCEVPFSTISLDHVAMPPSDGGKYMSNVIDFSTHLIVSGAVSAACTKEVIQHLYTLPFTTRVWPMTASLTTVVRLSPTSLHNFWSFTAFDSTSRLLTARQAAGLLRKAMRRSSRG